MDIATAILAHNNPEQVIDVIDSVRLWATKNILLVVDQVGWDHFKDFDHPNVYVICGHPHAARRSPYKNTAVAIQSMYNLWPNVDWYNCIEYDVLYLNSDFKIDLDERHGYSAVGFDFRDKGGSEDHWLVKDILGDEPDLKCCKMLGAVTFYSNHCVKSLIQEDYYNEIIQRTTNFHGDSFPDFHDYAVEEVIFPTAATLFGKVGNLSLHDARSSYYTNRYTVRFCPEVKPNEITSQTSIVHPVKDRDGPVHEHYRQVRELFLED